MKADLIIYNIGELISFRKGPLARVSEDNAVIIKDAGIAVRDGIIVAMGRSSEIKSKFEGEALDAQGLLATPGLVDPHTHLVFAGSREDEFNLKLQGVSYSEILAKGGGIYRTVKATLEASFNDLLSRAIETANLMLSHGTTTVEVKSGYALSLEGELKMLKVVKALGEISKITVIPTLLAHVPPQEYRESSLEYAKYFAEVIVPAVSKEGLAVYVDVFCDRGAFSVDESRIILGAGLKHGLRARMHADQLAYIGCSRLAAELPIDSMDHLERMPEENAKLLAEKGVVAVLTPTSIMAMMELKKPPTEALRRAGVIVAIASDYNPNNMTPLQQTAMDIAPYILNLTPLEALAAATVNAARSLNIHHNLGSISEGYRADIVLWDLENYKWIGYTWGYNKALVVIKNGKIAHWNM